MLVVDECAVSNGGCEHICINSQVGHHCECRSGYMLGVDHTSCLGNTGTLLDLVTMLVNFTKLYVPYVLLVNRYFT